MLDYLREKYASKRIILWYWNPVAKSINPLHIKTEKIEMWSFDIEDCEKYGLKYNTQFYFRENLNRGSDICKEFQEIFYVGKDKNRASLLKKLSTEFQAKGLTYLFYLVKSNRNQKDKDTEYRAALSYPDVLSYILNSKVLLDIVHEEQKGLTLRPLESLIFKRKLITNMLNIDCYPIYNKNNVFILGVDDVSEILDFINGEYDEFYYNELLEYYAFDSWLSRFDMTHENVGEYE